MLFREFLSLEKISKADFARRIEVTSETVRLIDKGRVPRRAIVERIHRESGGLVCPNDLYGLHPAPAPRSAGQTLARIAALFGLGGSEA